MSEFKNFIVSIILLLLLCAGCFFGGYLFCDRNATKRIEEANNQLAEQQLKYDELIKSSDERIRNIKEELYKQMSSNGEAARELSKLIEQIEKQRISL